MQRHSMSLVPSSVHSTVNSASTFPNHDTAQNREIRIIFRSDDMGSTHAANIGCIDSYVNGLVRSVELMVPCPWFPEAVKLLHRHPGLDVGVHLTLTSEWENMKWRPLTSCTSIVDSYGFFLPMTRQRSDFPPHTGFLQSGYRLKEVETELRAQIELARRTVPWVTHLTSHMGAATSNPELKNLVQRLAEEYGLPHELPVQPKLFFPYPPRADVEVKTRDMIGALETVQPGLYLYYDHCGKDSSEMRALSHKGYENVAQDRDGVTKTLTHPRVKEIVQQRKIRLISYLEAISQPEDELQTYTV